MDKFNGDECKHGLTLGNEAVHGILIKSEKRC